MGVLKNIMSVFVEMDDESNHAKYLPTDEYTFVEQRKPVFKATKADLEKFEKHFDKLFDDADLPGPDYKEYSESLVNMATLAEDQQFLMAYNALKSVGLTKEKLISSIGHYLNIIEQDKEAFITVLEDRDAVKKSKAEELLKNSNDEIADLEDKLNTAITNRDKAIADLSTINDSDTKANYLNICALFTTKLREHLTKINKYVSEER